MGPPEPNKCKLLAAKLECTTNSEHGPMLRPAQWELIQQALEFCARKPDGYIRADAFEIISDGFEPDPEPEESEDNDNPFDIFACYRIEREHGRQ